MFKFVIFYSALVCALSAALPLDGATASDDIIVGGDEVEIEKYPWQVALEKEGCQFCGGSIYSENIIVTAAHCLQSVSVENVYVRYGSSDRGLNGHIIQAAAMILHEHHNVGLSKTNDIAVIKLSSPIQFSNRAQPIKLATVRPHDGELAHTSGWGDTSHGGFPSDKLRDVAVNILNLPACSSDNYYYGKNILDKTMICAYVPGKDSCQGDSGGPLVVDNTLVGVVSWGIGCAGDGYPGVYADVVYQHSWLLQTIQSLQLVD